jgi:hypothetical protein
MALRTAVAFDRRRTYRLIGRDLYSALSTQRLADQEYVLEKPSVVRAGLERATWRVVIRKGEIWLERTNSSNSS